MIWTRQPGEGRIRVDDFSLQSADSEDSDATADVKSSALHEHAGISKLTTM